MISNASSTDSNKTIIVTTGRAVTPDHSEEKVTSKQNEDDASLYIVMTAVIGCVVFIMAITCTIFIIKSRHRRRQNLRRFNERLQRPPISLEVIDREELTRETINGVSYTLYGQDNILPVTVFDNQSHQGQTDQISGLTVEASPTLGTQSANISDQQGENGRVNGDISVIQEGRLDTSAPVYENTKVETEKQPVEPDHDYETAFPAFDDQSKREYENVETTSRADTTDSFQPANGKDINEKNEHITEKQPTKAAAINTGRAQNETPVNNDNVAKSKSEKPKPKIKPKQAAGVKSIADNSRSEDKTIAHENNKDEFHDYENSLEKVKSSKFQQAKLLKTVPPPCNMNPYINVPDDEPLIPSSEISLQRQLSEYEDPAVYLNKHVTSRPKTDELKGKRIKSKPKHVLSNTAESQRSESRSKVKESKSKKSVSKPVSSKPTQSESKANQSDQKPEYANVTVQNLADNKSSASVSFDYENEETVMELKSTLKRLGKRGFSTSSLETCKKERNSKPGFSKEPDQKASELGKEIDDEYLTMDAVKSDDAMYLKMDADTEVYMPMVAPEVYMQMERNYNFEKSGASKTLQPSTLATVLSSPKGHCTSPKPCGGIDSTGYVNFSDQPIKYVNFFRSRSTDNVYMYADTKSKNFKP